MGQRISLTSPHFICPNRRKLKVNLIKICKDYGWKHSSNWRSNKFNCSSEDFKVGAKLFKFVARRFETGQTHNIYQRYNWENQLDLRWLIGVDFLN